MEEYNKLISSHILDNYENMIHTAPQPTMLGGKRIRKYVLPASTDYDYPSSLAVGNPNTEDIGGTFWKDFTGMKGKGRKMEGGDAVRDAMEQIGKVINPVTLVEMMGLGRHKKKSTKMEGGFNISDLSNPLLLGYDLGKEVIGPALFGKGKKRDEMLKKMIADVAKTDKKSSASVAPIGLPAPKTTKASQVAPSGKGRRRKGAGIFDTFKSVGKSVGNVGKAVGKELLPVAKDVALDVGKEALRDYLKSKKNSGGVLIRNDMSEFHSSVYPPALASYKARPMVSAGKRATLPKSGSKRNSARGAIVAEVMKKKGMNLAQASKYVKEHNLY